MTPIGPADRAPWGPGLVVAGLCAVLAGIGGYAFSVAVSQIHPLLAIALNFIAAVGAAPTLWRWRLLPVRRWIAYGCAAGLAIGWLIAAC
ncbi:MAG: DUF2537 domain-containing protein [Mycobacteriaceae bacterium]|nr:DUF2537 domain-containing protein [Mycobacteriaceae bacterium]